VVITCRKPFSAILPPFSKRFYLTVMTGWNYLTQGIMHQILLCGKMLNAGNQWLIHNRSRISYSVFDFLRSTQTEENSQTISAMHTVAIKNGEYKVLSKK